MFFYICVFFILLWVCFVVDLKFVSSVVVDVRERDRVDSALKCFRDEGVDCKARMLVFGDYLVNGCVVWEYKSVRDFIQSVFDESLFNEVFNQSVRYEYSFLVIVGDFNKGVKDLYYSNPRVRNRFRTMTLYRNWVNKVYNGAVRRCRTVCNVVFVPTMKGAFYEILAQSEKCLDGKVYGGVVRKRKDLRTLSPMESFLTGIGGIGDVTARSIISDFNVECLDDLVRITGDDLVKKNYARDKVKAFCEYVHGEEFEY